MSIRRRPLFVYMSLNSSAITGITLCNTHLAFVKDQLITYYKTMYQTKSRKEDAMALQGITSSFRRFLDRVEAVEREHKRPSAVLYCTVLYCTVLYCTVLYCVLCCTVVYCTVLYCTVLCTGLYCTVSVLYCVCTAVLYCTVLYCTVYCAVLHYVVCRCWV